MKKKLTILFSLAFLVAVLATTPAFALAPAIPKETPVTYTQVSVMTNPGTSYTWIGTLQVTIGTVTSAYAYGTPWGNSLTATATGDRAIDTTTFRGSAQVWTVLNFAKGTLNVLADLTYDGPGSYTYTGTTFPFTIGTSTGTIIMGTTYSGILFHGTAVGTGSNGLNTLEGITIVGISIMSGPNAGVVLGVVSGYIQSGS